MAFPVTQPFKRTTKSLRFEDDVLTKSQMLQATDDQYETWYAVIDKDTLEQYVYNSNATPSQETWKFVKKENWWWVFKAIRWTTTTTEIINAVNEWKNILVYWRQADDNPRLVTKVDVDSPYLVYLSCTFNTTDGYTYAELFTVHTDVETTWAYESTKLAKNAEIPTKTSDLTNDSNFQTDTEVQTKIDDAISWVTSFTYEVVDTLPTTWEKGKIYLIENASQEYDEYIWMDWDPTWKFEKIWSVNEVDLSNYYNKSEVDTELAKKQNTLVSWTNIKTFNWESLLGSGDIPIPTIVGSDWGVAKQGTVTVSGTTESTVSISDLNLTSASDYQVAITPSANLATPAYINKSVASFTVKIANNSGNKTLYYTIFAKGYGSVPNWWTTWQALVKKSNTDWDVEWKTVSGWWASLTIDTTQVGYWEATISEWWQNLSFTNQNWQWVRIWWISEDWEMVTSKSYVDSKSPTIVNEWATFTNAQWNQKMQIRTGGINSVIIKDTNSDWTTEYWSYELPNIDYVNWKLWDLTNLTTDNKDNLVNAINEVYEKSWEPFRVKNWASSWSAGVEIEPCTSDKTNSQLAKMVFSIDAVEWADYQIVGMISYEVFDNTSGGNRLNVWPVCQFTWNWQKELSVRWVCAGTTVKTAKRINAWVLLKHR